MFYSLMEIRYKMVLFTSSNSSITIDEIKQCIDNVVLDEQYVLDLICLSAILNTFSILEYIVELYPNIDYSSKFTGEEILLREPEDITSYEHARFLITKQLLEKYNIKYSLV